MAARTPRLERLAFNEAPSQRPVASAAAAAASVARSITATNTGLVGNLLKWSFYASVLALVVFCILLFIHFTYMPIFKFTNSQGVVEVPTTQDAQNLFSDTVARVDVKTDFVNPLSCSYTLMFDVYMLGDFRSTTAPRVLTYRSLNRVQVEDKIASFTPERDLLTLFPETNFIVWIDPIKNDLYAGVVTQQSGMAPVMHISEPVKNIPLRTPFRIGFVFDGDFLEIYMNGKLASTLTWQGDVKESLKPFFTPISVVDQSIFIANMSYWSRVLRPSDISRAGQVQNTQLFAKLTT